MGLTLEKNHRGGGGRRIWPAQRHQSLRGPARGEGSTVSRETGRRRARELGLRRSEGRGHPHGGGVCQGVVRGCSRAQKDAHNHECRMNWAGTLLAQEKPVQKGLAAWWGVGGVEPPLQLATTSGSLLSRATCCVTLPQSFVAGRRPTPSSKLFANKKQSRCKN